MAPPPAPSWSRTSIPGKPTVITARLLNSAQGPHERQRHAVLRRPTTAPTGQLWKSDGTAAGTVMVADINPGSGGLEPHQPDQRQRQRCTSRPTTATTATSCGRATAPRPAPSWSRISTPAAGLEPRQPDEFQRHAVFRPTTAPTATSMEERRHRRRHRHGRRYQPRQRRLEPRQPDECQWHAVLRSQRRQRRLRPVEEQRHTGGTTLLRDIYTGGINSNSFYVNYLTNVNGTFVFRPRQVRTGKELWKSRRHRRPEGRKLPT